MAKTIEDLVAELVKAHPELVENDKMLLLAVWAVQGLHLNPEQKMAWFDNCAAAESVTRARRFLIESGMIDQSPEAQRRRRVLAEQYRMRYTKQPNLGFNM